MAVRNRDWGLSENSPSRPWHDAYDHEDVFLFAPSQASRAAEQASAITKLDGAGAKPDWKSDGTSKQGGDNPNKAGGKNKTDNSDGSTNDPVTDSPTDAPTDTTPEFDYMSGLDSPDGFNISISYLGAWTDALKVQVEKAVEFISDLVLGDLPDHNGIDDLHIDASLTTIDGSGGYFGWGGYTSVRSDSGLPSSGYLELDTADISTMETYNVVDDFVFHEILHAMGFGTSWEQAGLVEDIDGSLRFTGTNAIDAYNTEYANIAANDLLAAYGVPVEMDGGSGTAGVHWDHDTFGQEMMTGTLGTTNVVSDMTVAALEDMGYATVYSDDLLFA